MKFEKEVGHTSAKVGTMGSSEILSLAPPERTSTMVAAIEKERILHKENHML
jgi:hypothetical protein